MPLPEVLVDLDRTTGGMLTLPPRSLPCRGGWHAGTADTLWRNDDGVVVGPDARVGGEADGEIALVGRAAELAAGTVVPAGGRLPEED